MTEEAISVWYSPRKCNAPTAYIHAWDKGTDMYMLFAGNYMCTYSHVRINTERRRSCARLLPRGDLKDRLYRYILHMSHACMHACWCV